MSPATQQDRRAKGGVSETATRVRWAALGQDTGAFELNLTRERINAGAKGEGKTPSIVTASGCRGRHSQG